MNLHEHCRRNAANALLDIARERHPDLAFQSPSTRGQTLPLAIRGVT